MPQVGLPRADTRLTIDIGGARKQVQPAEGVRSSFAGAQTYPRIGDLVEFAWSRAGPESSEKS